MLDEIKNLFKGRKSIPGQVGKMVLGQLVMYTQQVEAIYGDIGKESQDAQKKLADFKEQTHQEHHKQEEIRTEVLEQLRQRLEEYWLYKDFGITKQAEIHLIRCVNGAAEVAGLLLTGEAEDMMKTITAGIMRGMEERLETLYLPRAETIERYFPEPPSDLEYPEPDTVDGLRRSLFSTDKTLHETIQENNSLRARVEESMGVIDQQAVLIKELQRELAERARGSARPDLRPRRGDDDSEPDTSGGRCSARSPKGKGSSERSQRGWAASTPLTQKGVGRQRAVGHTHAEGKDMQPNWERQPARDAIASEIPQPGVASRCK